MTPDDEAILTYIRERQGTYTREAITEQLHDAGYDPAAIEAAWTSMDAAPASAPSTSDAAPAYAPSPLVGPPGARPPDRGGAIAGFVVVWVGILVVLGILQILTAIVLGSLSPSTHNPDLLGVLNVLFVVFVLGLLAGGIFFLARRQSLGRVLAVVGAVAFVWFVVVAGICFTA